MTSACGISVSLLDGHGHILRTIVPWLRREGVTDAQVVTMLVTNPRHILTIEWDSDVFAGPSGVLAATAGS